MTTRRKILTESDIDNIVRESARKVLSNIEHTMYLCEGINIRRQGNQGFISYDRSHERLINTSVETNPTVDTSLIPNVEVWSVFKRNNDGKNIYDIRRDGNPLIHAFKNNEYGWQFASEKDRDDILTQMKKILEKFHQSHPFGSTVMVPSRSEINTLMANMYLEINSNADIIKGVLLKMTTQEVFDEVDKPTSAFSRHYGDNIEDALERLCRFLDIMDEKNDGIFSYHEVTDKEMRNYIETTLKVCQNPSGAYGDRINGKDVLIIDDSISRGQTLRQAINLIQSNFIPNSITVLTLFSKL